MAGIPDPSALVVQTLDVVVSQNIVVLPRNASAFQADAFLWTDFQTLDGMLDAFQTCAFPDEVFQASPCRPSGGQISGGGGGGGFRPKPTYTRTYAVQSDPDFWDAVRRSRREQEDEELLVLVAAFVRVLS